MACQDGAVVPTAPSPALRRELHRWVYLLLGGAFALAGGVVLAWPVEVLITSGLPLGVAAPLAFLVVAAPLAAVGALAESRSIEGAAVGALLTGRAEERVGPSTTAGQRARTGLLLVLHVVAGGVAGGLLVVGLPTAVLLAATPDAGGLFGDARVPGGWGVRLALAVVLAVAVVAGGDLLGRGLAVLAPRLLAGSTAERLAAAEASVSLLAGRDRLARELHDSVGHSLSLVTVQAGAARRLLTRDPPAAETALRATEDAARRALVDLDHVLGLLREESGGPAGTSPAPDLRDLDALVGTARAAGARVEVSVTGQVGALPAVVSREAYRIVQEGLTNALRHAPGAACRLEVEAAGDLRIRLANEAPGTVPGASGGGRGLRGLRERARDLRGVVDAGPGDDGRWVLAVRLPVHARGSLR
ncbi:two-component sensor histidine kinase [Geodermatophilus normandii]|uniref:histidine kinase n=1 Tax=Geodermatophilus normandii TaxID=1137989 RepID=A0A6P0GE71_9ACTN|nr:histidine kinase [Geodermatophilus normandii]NEM05549.1 two-component sensor histidine kinase [Geodermatophilus normandii]